MRKNEKYFIFCLSRNGTLENWQKNGMLERELQLYRDLSALRSERLMIFSYGNYSEETKLVNESESVISMNKFLYKLRPRRLRNIIHLFLSYFKIFTLQISAFQTNQLSGALNALILAKCTSSKMVIRMGYYYTHFQGSTINHIPIFLERILFNQASKIITTNPKAKQYIKNKYSINNIHYIPNFISEHFKIMNIPVIYDFIYVGRFKPAKGSVFFENMVSKFTTKKFLLITNTTSLNYLTNFANLEILNYVPNKNIATYLNQSKYIVAMTNREGCPKSALEAVACGRRLVYKDTEGMDEFFDDYNFLKNYNLHDLSTEIDKIGENFIDKEASIDVQHKYSYQSVLNKYLNLYESF